MWHNSLKFLLLTALISPAWADDATEAAPTGNIVFEKAPELVMQDETLMINRSSGVHFGEDNFSIDVDFHFKNISNHDVTRKIAFVLPPVQCQMELGFTMWNGLEDSGNGPDQQQNKGLKDFTTTVDGKTITFTKRTEAMLGNRTITNLLTGLKIPLNPCQVQVTSQGKPDPRYQDNLIKYHLLTENNEAAWSENIYFEWTQIFPAGKVVNIHHHYTPVIGEAAASSQTISELNTWVNQESSTANPLWSRNPETLINSNPFIINTNKNLYPNDNQTRFCLVPEWVRYRLTTGSYWNGGIGNFKLIIQDLGGAPFAVNEFYNNTDQVQKSIGDNSMTFVAKNFIPSKDLFVLFLSLPKAQQQLQSCPGVGT